MLAQLLHVVAPVFGVAFVGWLFAGWRKVDLKGLTDIVLYLAAPALVFTGLARKPLEAGSMLAVGGGAALIVLVCGAVAFLAYRATKTPGRGLYLAAMFPNTGNLGLPLALFAFGKEGLAVAVLVFCVITVLHYSLGLMVMSGKPHPGEALKMPLMPAALLGVVVAVSGVTIPDPAMRFLELLGDATIPLMLLSLGIRMRSVRFHRPWRALLAVAVRMLPGLAAALVWVTLFDLQGAARGVLLVTGVLPSAVMNFVLTEAYGENGEDVAGAILLGTLISCAAIPLVLSLDL